MPDCKNYNLNRNESWF